MSEKHDCTEGCDGDHAHKWEIAPHPDKHLADTLVTDDDQEALQWLLSIAESEWDDCEPGETRTITIRHNKPASAPGEEA